ncbi:hypothetical protein [Azospirillum sp. TSH64]|uniref:hypothetical protein n=1 Tax=Azospirillum sp. TSH64 TaxID=652740 RepID=UPI0011B1F6C1|nr:hypothetical protein [Azospirillum sp. TSH64]
MGLDPRPVAAVGLEESKGRAIVSSSRKQLKSLEPAVGAMGCIGGKPPMAVHGQADFRRHPSLRQVAAPGDSRAYRLRQVIAAQRKCV